MAGHEYRKTRQPAVESKVYQVLPSNLLIYTDAHSQLCDQMHPILPQPGEIRPNVKLTSQVDNAFKNLGVRQMTEGGLVYDGCGTCHYFLLIIVVIGCYSFD
eukprot:1334767-Amorphochlora_amoeboformis.AAC.3